MKCLNRFLIALLSLTSAGSTLLAQDEPAETATADGSEVSASPAELRIKAAIEAIEKNGESPERLEELGDAYLAGRVYQKAIMAYDKVLKQGRGSEDIVMRLGEAFVFTGRPELALETLKIGVESYPESAKLNFELGKAYLGFQKSYAAVTAFKKALELDPNESEYKFFLAYAYRFQKKFDDAQAIVEELLRDDPDHLPARLMKGDLLLLNGKGAEGLAHLESVFEEDKSNEDAKFVLLNAYQTFAYNEVAAGRREVAVTALEKAIELDGEALRPKLDRAVFLEQLGKVDEAERASKEIMEQFPQNLDVYLLYGHLLKRAERKDEAIEMFRQGYAKARAEGADQALEAFAQSLKELDATL